MQTFASEALAYQTMYLRRKKLHFNVMVVECFVFNKLLGVLVEKQ